VVVVVVVMVVMAVVREGMNTVLAKLKTNRGRGRWARRSCAIIMEGRSQTHQFLKMHT
jgi:hypothetical protein